MSRQMANGGRTATELYAIRKHIRRCLESETASRQAALEEVDRMLAGLLQAVLLEAR